MRAAGTWRSARLAPHWREMNIQRCFKTAGLREAVLMAQTARGSVSI